MGSFDHLIPPEASKNGDAQSRDGGKDNPFEHLIPSGNKSSGMGNFALGLVRGARDIVDGPAYLLPKGIEKLASVARVDSIKDWASEEANRVSNINQDAEEQYQSLTPGSTIAGVGRVGANIFSAFIPGTGQIKSAKAIKQLIDGGEKAKAVAAIGALGATQNAVLNTKTNNDDLIGNAAIGGIVAPIGAGIAGGASNAVQGVRNMLAGSDGRIGKVLSNASGIPPADLAKNIERGNIAFIAGSSPTTSQAAMNPGISQLERSIRNHGYSPLIENDALQNSARILVLDEISPGASQITSAETAYNAGKSISSESSALRDEMQKQIRDLYESKDLQSASINYPGKDSIIEAVEGFYPGAAYQEAPPDLRRIVGALSSSEGSATFKEFDAFRKILGNRSADLRQSDKTASAAFGAVKSLLDDAQQLAIGGSRIAPEAGQIAQPNLMTQDQADILSSARKLFEEKIDRFESGPSRAIFRNGADGLPQREGAQVAAGFFNSGASQSEDIEQLLKMLPEPSGGIDAIKQYAISDLLEKSLNANGALSASKLNSWINRRKPAIDRLFSDQQISTLSSVQSDISRQFNAESLGMAAGSNTAQNMIGEGLLDTRAASLLSRLLPYVGPAGLEVVKSHQKKSAVQEVGGAMVNPEVAIRALNVYEKLINRNATQRALDASFPTMVPASTSFDSNR